MFSIEDFSFSVEELHLLGWLSYTALVKEADNDSSRGFWSSLAAICLNEESSVTQSRLAEIKRAKRDWLNNWKQNLKKLLNLNDINFDTPPDLAMQDFARRVSKEKLMCFIIEAATVEAYYPLTGNDADRLKGVKLNQGIFIAYLSKILSSLDSKYNLENLIEIRNVYFNSTKQIAKGVKGSNNTLMWMGASAVVIFVIAPYLAAGIGGLMGLSGAAATSAGLALLGGGSIAAGGFGMAGGTFALMAGGLLVGYKVGDVQHKNSLSQISAENLLVSGAKLYTAIYIANYFKLYTSFIFKNVLVEICSKTRSIQYDLETEVDNSCVENSCTTERRKELIKKTKVLSVLREKIRNLPVNS